MKKVYVYLLDDMAECEIGYILRKRKIIRRIVLP